MRGCYIILAQVEFVCCTLRMPFILDVAGGKSGCAQVIKVFRECLKRLPQIIKALVFINDTYWVSVNFFLGWRDRMTAPSQRAMVTSNATAKCLKFETAMAKFNIVHQAGNFLQVLYDDPNAEFINPDNEAGNAAATERVGDQGRTNYACIAQFAVLLSTSNTRMK